MPTASAHIYEFGAFQLDTAERVLRRLDGTLVPLTPRVFKTLAYMVENRSTVLDKERIMEAVWPDTIVEENNLAQAISKLRQVFGETPGADGYIVTVPGRGYRFVADVREVVEQENISPESRELRSASSAEGDSETKIAEPVASSIVATSEISAPAPPNRRRFLAAAIVGIAIAGVTALLLVRYRNSPAGVQTPSSFAPANTALSAPAQIPEKSIAVLPFENRSRDPDNAFFTDGVQDEILTDLARIADLKVISRTSVMQYKTGAKRNLRQIGNELGVAHVVEGSVQRAGNRVRVNAQLIDARNDAHLWAQTYDRDLADVFAIQSEIAKAIAGQLQAKLSPSEKSAIEQPLTDNINAFDLYARARNLILQTSVGSEETTNLLQAAELLTQAVARDPSFFDAYCQLAYAHDALYFFGYDHTPARLTLAEAAIQTAFRLRPNAGEAHLARAWNLYRGYLDYDGALAELEVARQSLPNDARVIALKGWIERRQGRWEESIRNLERPVDLDPRNVDTRIQTSLNYGLLRRYPEQKAVLDRVLAIVPDDAVTKAEHAGVELNWHADTLPLHQTIDSIQATNPRAMSKVANSWIICALSERNPDAARNALVAFGENRPQLAAENVPSSRLFLEGVIARMAKDEDKARSAFTGARAEQEKIVQAQPNYAPALCVLGLIDAGLGRKEDALREGRRAAELLPVEKDSINGPAMIKYFAIIAAWVEEKNLACEQLAIAISHPSSLSYGQLKLLPFWDPLRGDPRFEQIVASLAPK
jgi:TolB-like protein/DNA-binding winged helix-turn-helix (wHTH) protein/Tfp pilus assembly protein PilF